MSIIRFVADIHQYAHLSMILMQKNDSNIIPDPQGVGYADHTRMNGSPGCGSYSVRDVCISAKVDDE